MLSCDGLPAEVIDLRTGYGLRIGWAHVHHLQGSDRRTSIVKELFVWPTFRGKGLGRLLEQGTVGVALNWYAERMQLLLHEPDDFEDGPRAGRALAEAAGYELAAGKQVRPCLAATWEKPIREASAAGLSAA